MSARLQHVYTQCAFIPPSTLYIHTEQGKLFCAMHVCNLCGWQTEYSYYLNNKQISLSALFLFFLYISMQSISSSDIHPYSNR